MKRRDFLATSAAVGIAVGLLPSIAWAKNRDAMLALRLDEDLRHHIAGLDAMRNEGVSAEDLVGRPVVINFWASWCPPCHEEAQIINRLHAKWKNDAVFLSINVFEQLGGLSNPAKLNRFLDKHKQPNPILEGKGDTRARFANLDRIPTVMIFDGHGAMHYLFVHEQGAERGFMAAPEDVMDKAISEAVDALAFQTQCNGRPRKKPRKKRSS